MPALPGGCGAALSLVAKHMGCRKGADTDICLKADQRWQRALIPCGERMPARDITQQSLHLSKAQAEQRRWVMLQYCLCSHSGDWWGAEVRTVAGSCGLSCLEIVSVSQSRSSARREPRAPRAARGLSRLSTRGALAWGVFVYSTRLEHHCGCKSSVLLTEQIVPANKE